MPKLSLGLGLGQGDRPLGAFDPDASSFFARAGITDATQKEAVTALVLDLKAASLWSKILVLYPFVGGAATPHSKNLKADLYNITWVNGPTHDSNGVTGDGVAAYGNTTFNPVSASLAWNDATIGAYVNSAGSSANKPLLVAQSDAESAELLLSVNSSDEVQFDVGNYSGRSGNYSIAAQTGFFSGSRGGAADERTYRNGTLVGDLPGTGASPMPNLNLYLFAFNYEGAAVLFSNHRVALGFIGTNLSGAEHATLYGIVDVFETALGRQV